MHQTLCGPPSQINSAIHHIAVVQLRLNWPAGTGRKATTHWTAFELLAEFGATPVRQRWVHDGPILTAAGQSAGIDMGLYLVQRLAGVETARLTQFAMEYDPEPPLGRMDWEQAPHDIFDPHAQTWVEDGLTENPELQHVWSPGCARPRPLDRAPCVAGWPR